MSWGRKAAAKQEKKGHKWEFNGREEPEDTRREIKVEDQKMRRLLVFSVLSFRHSWSVYPGLPLRLSPSLGWMRRLTWMKECRLIWRLLCASDRPRWTGSLQNSALSLTATRSASDPGAAIVQPSSAGDAANVTGADRKRKNQVQQFLQPPLTLKICNFSKPDVVIIFIDVI